eukprot:8349373-Karenia_brevis.AAC.1
MISFSAAISQLEKGCQWSLAFATVSNAYQLLFDADRSEGLCHASPVFDDIAESKCNGLPLKKISFTAASLLFEK